MGGCCCSSRKPPQLHGTPIFYYFPPASEEYESLTSDDSAAIALTSGFLDDLNIDRSTPDTYRSPPAPIPFEVVLGHPQSRGSEFPEEPLLHNSYESTFKDIKQSDCKAETEFLLASLKKTGIGLVKSNPPIIQSAEEEDVCPTCLEGVHMDIIGEAASLFPSSPTFCIFIQPVCDWLIVSVSLICTCFAEYDADNPRIVTKCNHHFHLSCLLEWMERSQTCPICNQDMIYEHL